jgi:hypothetical protein
MRTHGKSTQKFTLTALKLYTGQLNWDGMNDEVDVAHTTASYNINQFELAPVGTIIFEDNLENGTGKWAGGYQPWTIDNGSYFNGSHAWKAANTNASLKTVVNLSNANDPVLKFRTYHRLGGNGDTGYVKVSTDGNNWQTVATFSENSDSWETKILDLSSFAANAASLQVRFELASAGGDPNDYWYIDDILIVGITDSDGDGIPDEEDGNGDPDGDGIPNYLDTDSDGDGIPDKTEGTGDPDGDGIPNYLDLDSDGDSMPDKDEWTNSGLLPYCGNQGGIDTDEDGRPNCRDNDVDGDGIPNYLDTDSDGDGKPDSVEIGSPTNPTDTDGDSIPDYLDSEDITPNFGIILQSVYVPFIKK